MLHKVQGLSNQKLFAIETNIKNYRQYGGIDIRILAADNQHVNVNISQTKQIGVRLTRRQLVAKAKTIFQKLPPECTLNVSAKTLQ